MDMFKQAADVLEGLRWAEAVKSGKCDWKRPEDKAWLESHELAMKRARQRPDNGCCPNCSEFVEGRWVYEPVVMCWSCFQVGGGRRGSAVDLDGIELTGDVVKAARMRRCWSREVLGRKVGKSGSWIQKFENGTKISDDLVVKLRKVLKW